MNFRLLKNIARGVRVCSGGEGRGWLAESWWVSESGWD